ncbi:DUF368 domain-containing protein [Bremerella cremea]|uniref:DUF368 domain-containing protein n=1 Tax=Bremerella cremea TaxID=1031537 RepID=A0A368KPW4_9BACT|nr:DUF368 domain-containing protein [Bremerella cremea]RCS47626.1 DUF368 domain-containing protein [Bremerella cremea]
MSEPRINSVRHFLCGLAMGAADAVPGISGGTVALVLGIYRRLVDAISQVNGQTFHLLRKRDWKALAERFDIWFLLALLAGVACGILTFVTILHDLIGEPDHPARTKPLVYATFFGAIAGSGYLVTRMIHPKNRQHLVLCIVLAIVGGGFAYWLTSLPALNDFTTAPNPLVSFLLGAIAICAMILPGISGSYLLLILGAYHYFSGIPKAMAKGQLVMEDVFAFACFALGCLFGLLSFSKFLKWLLHQHEAATLSLMGGFMIGALKKLWPWDESAPVENPYPHETISCFALMVLAAAVVIAIDYIARPKAADPL